jgi:hypothetical protein
MRLLSMIVLAIVVGGGVASCKKAEPVTAPSAESSNPRYAYSEATRSSFLATCHSFAVELAEFSSGGARATELEVFCDCQLVEFQKVISEDEFEALGTAILGSGERDLAVARKADAASAICAEPLGVTWPATYETATYELEYSEHLKRGFVAACMTPLKDPVSAEKFCGCAYDQIAETVPVADFVAYSADVNAGRTPDTETAASILSASNACTHLVAQ